MLVYIDDHFNKADPWEFSSLVYTTGASTFFGAASSEWELSLPGSANELNKFPG